MESIRHPEFPTYLRDRGLYEDIQKVLAAWKGSQESIPVITYDLEWRYDDACHFAWSLSAMFRAYNQVLWDEFPYCRSCLGQCCLRGGAFVAVFDLLALAWLEQPFPSLPERIDARADECIYRSVTGCLWHADWRTFKCWMFFCTGAHTVRHAQKPFPPSHPIVRRLGALLDERMPQPLRSYEQKHRMRLSASLLDPLAGTEALGQALDAILVAPLVRRFPWILPADRAPYYRDPIQHSEPIVMEDADWQALLCSLDQWLENQPGNARLVEGMPDPRMLEDIELLEWIALGKPAAGADLLAEMLQRYRRLSRSEPNDETARQIRRRIQRLLKELYATPSLF